MKSQEEDELQKERWKDKLGIFKKWLFMNFVI